MSQDKDNRTHRMLSRIDGKWLSTAVKKVNGFPVPSRNVTYQTLPGWE
jgi:hypothetical protein